MSGLSHHQSVFRITKPETTNNSLLPKLRKRNRQTASCAACRTRKLKCDRAAPCSSCSKRGDASACVYSNDSQPTRKDQSRASRSTEASLRLQKLEGMVLALMQTPSSSGNVSSQSPCILDTDRTPENLLSEGSDVNGSDSMGHLDSQGSDRSYVGSTHWATILENVGWFRCPCSESFI